jgi:hypothetical protein
MDIRLERADTLLKRREQEIAEMQEIVETALQRHRDVNDMVQLASVETSKLQYELGVLDERLKEVQDFMNDFEHRVS